MYYVPATTNFWQPPVTYVPVYSTAADRTYTDTAKVNEDLSRVRKELVELREELSDLRSDKSNCSICSTARRRSSYSEVKNSTYYPCPRPIQDAYYHPSSPIHYCSICHDYVIDDDNPPRSYSSFPRRTRLVEDDKLSEYLARQIDLQRLRHRYIPPEHRPIWIPTGYKNDYPHRRWVTRHAHFSEP